MPNQYYVAAVDDEPGMRFLLRSLFESAGLLVRCYDSAEALLADNEEIRFGCIVADLRLNGISGIQLLGELRRRGGGIPIVIISGRASVSDAVAAFRENAAAFFEKPFDNNELVASVKQLMGEWAAKQEKREALAAILTPLSVREREVLEALVTGKKTAQIAHELGISASTVEKHRIRVFEKTGVDSVIGLVHLLSGYQFSHEAV
jgi:two-component system response regulator DctR